MSWALRTVAFAALTAAGTAAAGWWAVPALAVLWVRTAPCYRGSAPSCALGAALGWAILVGWAAAEGPAGLVAERVGGVLQLPVWGLPLLTVLFPAFLAGAAARGAQPALPP